MHFRSVANYLFASLKESFMAVLGACSILYDLRVLYLTHQLLDASLCSITDLSAGDS